MLGWFSDASSRASRSNRASRSGSLVKSVGRTLIATSRPQRGVARPVDLAHAARPEPRDDRVGPDLLAGSKGGACGAEFSRRRRQCRCCEKRLARAVVREQCLGLTPEFFVAGARLDQKAGTLRDRALERLLADPFEVPVAITGHTSQSTPDGSRCFCDVDCLRFLTPEARMRLSNGLVGAVLAVAITSTPRAQAPAASVGAAPDSVRTLVVAARSRALQGHDQGADAVRRPAAGHRAESPRDRLDRSAAQELRLPDRAHQVRVQDAAADPQAAPRRPWRAGPERARCRRRPSARACACGPASTTIRMRQPDARLRTINARAGRRGPREQVYCTKIGTTRPGEMYILGAHMDGHRLGRGRQRRRLGHGAGDGAGADLSACPTCRPIARSASRCGTTKRRG